MTPAIPTQYLVTIGASAGGVEALSALVATFPTDFPAPIIIAQHLDPSRTSHLATILARRSTLPVRSVTDRETFSPGVIYVVPSDRHVAITDHHIGIDPDGPTRPKPSIDLLFRTAAATFGENLIAVVLTGLGSDGAAGARAVKEAGGTVVIQNPRTARYPSMPQSLAPTTVDVIAELEAMGPLLRDLITGAYHVAGPSDDRELRTFLEELRDRNGIDFGRYKMATINRRLERRLAATETRTLADYRAYLQRNPAEYDRLINAFLINVTGFFRDADVFLSLRDQLLPELIARGRGHGRELRLWSAGCATGEEAYSLAILIAAALGDELEQWKVRIFATDLDGEAIEFARRGLYPVSAIETVPADLRDAAFTAEEDGYRVTKRLRNLIIFGEHDLGQRPPFPRIDLVLCRNVLIYFTPVLQQQALEVFAFALRDAGLLVLGKAETTSALPHYFAPVDHGAMRIFRRQGERIVLPLASELPGRFGERRRVSFTPATEELTRVRREAQRAYDTQMAAEELLLRLPVGIVVVDRRYDIQRITNTARRLLGIHTAAIGEDLVHLARGVPALALRAAIDAAFAGDTESTLDAIPTDVVTPGETRYLRITCQPQTAAGQAATSPLVVVNLIDVTEDIQTRAAAESRRADAARLQALVDQLTETNRTLVTANEELATANALLHRSNEEYVVGNEEIQAATEEAETLNEEMQATNEELETLNEEMQATVEELEATNEELRSRYQETKELAEAVAVQRQRLAAILGSMGEAVAVFDQEGALVFSNAPFAAIVGEEGRLDARDAEGRPLPPDAAPLRRLRDGEAFQLEFTLPGPDGALRHYEALGRPVRDDAPHQDAVLVIRDITDRTLRQLQDEFLAMASHELRTPLTATRGYVDLVGRGIAAGKDPAQLATYVEVMRTQLRHLEAQITDLMEASRLGASHLSHELAPVDIGEVAARAVELGRGLAPGRMVELAVAPETLIVMGDAERLERVVLQLLENAFVYAPTGPIAVQVRREGADGTIAVRDQGPGIPSDVQAQLFTRFYRAPRERSSRGFGLGLYIAREVVTAHGGRIAVEATVGEGTTFTVRLPLVGAEDAERTG